MPSPRYEDEDRMTRCHRGKPGRTQAGADVSLSAVRSQIIDAADGRAGHADRLEAVASLLDKDGYPEHAGRARARAETLRANAAELRKIAGPAGLCMYGHAAGTARPITTRRSNRMTEAARRTVVFDVADPAALHALTQALSDYAERQLDMAAIGDSAETRLSWAAFAKSFHGQAEAAAAGNQT
jgi:hypothetical protein